MTTYRHWRCSCGHEFDAPVVYGPTTNISGEKRVYCPKCGNLPLCASPHFDKPEES